MIMIFFDVGVVGIVFFVLMVAGMGAVTEFGVWLHENFVSVAVIMIIAVVVKIIFMMICMKIKIYEGILCSIVDVFRMIPAWIFLNELFASFVEINQRGFFEFILGFVSILLGVCFAGGGVLFLMSITELACMTIMEAGGEDGGSGWVWGYLIVALIGTGVQLLFLKLIGMI